MKTLVGKFKLTPLLYVNSLQQTLAAGRLETTTVDYLTATKTFGDERCRH